MSNPPLSTSTEMKLRSALDVAMNHAVAAIRHLAYPGTKSSDWGRVSCDKWIAGLHLGFAASYPASSVYSKAKPAMQPLGGIKRREFLYDILVAEVAEIKSAKKRQVLHVIRRPVWAIESEVATNSRSVIEDLSKLVVSGAPHNLLVVSQSISPAKFPDLYHDASQGFMRDLFVAVIPSYSRLIPNHLNWREGTATCDLFRREGHGAFTPLSGSMAIEAI